MKKQIFVRAAASAAVLILLSPLLAGAAAAVQPDVSRNGSGASADAAAGVLRTELPRLSAKSAVLLDAYTGRVLYASHAEDKSLIASTTKIMTALVICEAGDLDRTVVIPPEAVGIEGSSMYLKAGEVLSVHELLYGLMLRSGNDAAVALALADSGSISAFAMRMNEKAAVLGLKNTHYANPHGLDSELLHRARPGPPDALRAAKSRFCAARLDEIRHHRRPRPDQPQQTSMAIFRRDRRKDRLYPNCGPDSGRRGGARRTAAHRRHDR